MWMKNKLQKLLGVIALAYRFLKNIIFFGNITKYLVSGQFKKTEKATKREIYGDWYNNHTWFEMNYFLSKLKRKFMGFIYRISSKINDLTCEKYFTRIIFHNYDDTFKAELPLIIYCDNYDDGGYVIGSIVDELVKTYCFRITSISDLRRLDKNELVIQKQRIIEEYTRFGYNAMGELTFIPMNRKNVLLDNVKLIVTPEDNSLAGLSGSDNSQPIDFRVVKSNHLLNGLYQNVKYQIYIKIIDNTTPKSEPVTQEHLDVIIDRINHKSI